MSKVISIAAPIVGGIFGGPWGAALGGAIGGAIRGGDFKDIATGAITGYAGSALGGSLFGDAAGAVGGDVATGAAGLGGGAGSVGGSYTADAFGTAAGFGGADAAFNIPLGAAGSGAGAAISNLGGYTEAPAGGSYAAEAYGTPAGFGGETAPMNVPTGTAPIMGEAAGLGSSLPAQTTEPNFFDQARSTISGLGDSFNATQFGQKLAGLRQSVSSVLPNVSPGVKQGLGLASAGLSLYSGYEGLKAAEEMKRRSEMYDQRLSGVMGRGPSKYRAQLDALMADPSSLERTPGYMSGLQAVERRLAAQGFTGSGNAKAALAKYGGDVYAQQVELLRRLAESEESGNYNEAQQLIGLASGYPASVNMRGQGLASIGYGVRGLGL